MSSSKALPSLVRPRIHIGLVVRDLERSRSFYRSLLGVEPSKVRPGYTKFEPETPAVNLALNTGTPAPPSDGGSAFHYGIQVTSSEEVLRYARRLEECGYSIHLEEETTCCYSVQTKVWAHDPDGYLWEVFVVLQPDADRRADADSLCCRERSCQ